MGRDTPVYRPKSSLHMCCVLSVMDMVGNQTLKQTRWALVCRDAGWEGPASLLLFRHLLKLALYEKKKNFPGGKTCTPSVTRKITTIVIIMRKAK